MNGVDALMKRVGSSRPPLVPAVPPMHPRQRAAPSEGVSTVAQEPTAPSAQGAVTPRSHGVTGTAAKVPTRVTGTYAPRRGKVQLREDQETWLNGLVADAIREGVRFSEGDVLRLALDRLREGKADWAALREAILAETKARTRRRGI